MITKSILKKYLFCVSIPKRLLMMHTLFFQAIKRLSGNDERFIIQICDVLNKVFSKGREIEDMKQIIKDFREKAFTTEDQPDYKGTKMKNYDISFCPIHVSVYLYTYFMSFQVGSSQKLNVLPENSIGYNS